MTHVSMSVTFTGPTRFAFVFGASKIARNTFLAFLAHCQIETGMADGLCLWPFVNQFNPCRFSGFSPRHPQQFRRHIGQWKVVAVTDGCVTVTVLETRNALSVITRITYEKRFTPRALGAHRVIETCKVKETFNFKCSLEKCVKKLNFKNCTRV